MNQTSKSTCATQFGASFPSHKFLLQRTNDRVFQISCSMNWNHFSSTKASPLELISSSSSLSESRSIRSSLYFWRMSISHVLKPKLFGGATAILFFSRVSVSMVDLDFSVVAACCSRGHFWVQKKKFRNVSASDISPMSGIWVNLLPSIRMLLFLAVIECQSRLNGKTYHVWSYLG